VHDTKAYPLGHDYVIAMLEHDLLVAAGELLGD
jgi:hypothetical protein